MAHKHFSGELARCLTCSKSSTKAADFLYPELPGQWHDLKFPDEEFFQPSITKQRAVEGEKGSPSAHRASFSHRPPYSTF